MKVYIQIGSTRERIEFDLNPSDTIEVLKAKINEDRGIPIKIQRIYKNYQARNEREVLSDDTKVSEIKKDHSKDSFPWHVADEYDGDGNPINQDYLRLYMFGEGLKLSALIPLRAISSLCVGRDHPRDLLGRGHFQILQV